MKRMWWLAGLSALIALAVLVMPITAMSLRAQAGPTMSQPLDQLSGDDFDKAFLAQMTMHHAMAVEMARPLLTKAVHPEMQALGQAITDAQTREIVQMRAWAKDWYGLELPDHLAMMAAHHQEGGAGMPGMQAGGMMNPANMPMHQSMHPGQGMPMHQGQGMPMHQQGAGPMGMMGDMHEMSMMGALDKLPPNRLEAVFMSLMIPHHQDALDMAALIPDRAAHQEIKDLGKAIITSQSAEIEQMNGWLSSWYGL